MRYAVVSDIHGNNDAWQAVLADIRKHHANQILCLGDIVGYGPCPGEVVDSIRKNADHTLLGNHDAVVCDLLDPEGFNEEAIRILRWTRDQCTPEQTAFLAAAPMELEGDWFGAVHAESSDPSSFYYLETEDDARACWAAQDYPLLLVGHTHVPMVHRLDRKGAYQAFEPGSFTLQKGCRYIINVGSVGLPRQGDWKPCYILIDDTERKITWRWVPYDMESHLQKIRDRLGGSREQEALYQLYLQSQGRQPGQVELKTASEYRKDFKPGIRVAKAGEPLLVRQSSLQHLSRYRRQTSLRRSSPRRRTALWITLTLLLVLVGAIVLYDWYLNPASLPRKVRQPPRVPAVVTAPASEAAGRLRSVELWLSEQEPVPASNGAGEVMLDLSASGNPITLDRAIYFKGLGVQAPSELVYRVPPSGRRFKAVAGLDDKVKDNQAASVVLEVWAAAGADDDNPTLLLRTDVLRNKGDRKVEVDEALPEGTRLLRLVVTDAGDGNEADQVDWAGARIIAEEP